MRRCVAPERGPGGFPAEAEPPGCAAPRQPAWARGLGDGVGGGAVWAMAWAVAGLGGGAARRRPSTRGAHQQRHALGELVRLGTAVGAADDEAVRLPLVCHELAQHAVDLRRE